MRFSLRARLLAIVVTTVLAFLAVIATSAIVTRRVDDQLTQLQHRQIPKLEAGPTLIGQFGSLRRAYQDAVGAHDLEALQKTPELRTAIVRRLAVAEPALDPQLAAAFRTALDQYHDVAFEVARQMIAGEGGEAAVERMELMQRRQARAQDLLDRLVSFDEHDLGLTFDTVHAALDSGQRARLVVAVASLAFVLLLSAWLSRGIVRPLAGLHAGFRRFAEGSFDTPIVVASNDELADAALGANRMAESLQRLAVERDRRDRLKTGTMELAKTLEGDLAVETIATRTARTLALRSGAAAAAFYVAEREGQGPTLLRLRGHYSLTPGSAPGETPAVFALGEGLVGEAARSSDVIVIDDAPADALAVRSGLAEGRLQSLLLASLVHDEAVVGVLELGFFTRVSDEALELIRTVRGTIGSALAVAEARAATRALLEKTQAQEEELKATNEELQCQQEELRQTNEELAEHARRLADQRKELEAKNAELEEIGRRLEEKATELTTVSGYKSQFLANMSHELRTPLNSMLLLSQLIAEDAEGNLSAKQREYAKTVTSAGKELLALINQVLDLAKVESGKQEIRIESVRLDELADRVRRIFSPLAQQKGLELHVDLDPSAPTAIRSDGQRLLQILTNLVGNAIKFTDRGQVALSIGRPAPSVRLRTGLSVDAAVAFTVRDTGIGIERAHQDRIFAPFEQVDGSSQRRQGGTGLGLSISRELSALLGGEIQLRSSPGEGSTFVCYLPIEAPMQPTATSTPIPVPPPAAEARGDAAILVIEDDPVFSGLLADIIRDRRLTAIVASDGAAGLRMAREHRPRGIILDVKLPDTDGWRVMEALSADPATSSIPVHFISGVEMPERGLAMGACGYLVKPASRADLVRVVDSLGPKAERARHRVLVVEGDPGTADTLSEQLTGEGFSVNRASSPAAALDLLSTERFACMILDLTSSDQASLELLEVVRQRPGISAPAIVLYVTRPLNRADATRVESYVEAVVLNEGASTDRLLDEVRLFVRRLEAGLPRRSLGARVREAVVRLDGRKLLVVDDDMRTIYALSAALRGKGAEVLMAETGKVALDVLARNPDVEAVLMDVMMPEMDGLETTRRIRQQARFAELPIITLTAKAMKGDRERCLEAGATDYLPKPVDAEALLTLLHARLGPARKRGAG